MLESYSTSSGGSTLVLLEALLETFEVKLRTFEEYLQVFLESGK